MVLLSGGSGINLSYDGNVAVSSVADTVVTVEVSITEDTQLTASNTNNIDVFLCEGNAANKEIILPINITLNNYVINILNTSDQFPLRIKSIESGDNNYSSELVANIYTWSYPPYDSSGDIILEDSDNTTSQSNLILPPKRAIRLRYILNNEIIYFYEV